MSNDYSLDELVGRAQEQFGVELSGAYEKALDDDLLGRLRDTAREIADDHLSHFSHTEVALRYALETLWLAVDDPLTEAPSARQMITDNVFNYIYDALLADLETWRSDRVGPEGDLSETTCAACDGVPGVEHASDSHDA